MISEPIAPLGAGLLDTSGFMPAPASSGAPDFAALLEQIGSLNTRMQASDAALQAVALGDGAQLHRVLMDLEGTRLSFDLLLQVRNKVLDAYQELMRLQV